jgi:hypothetical protein
MIFLYVANLALGLSLVLTLIASAGWFPLSFRAVDRFPSLLRHWLTSASWLLGTLATDDERAAQARAPLFRWRMAQHLRIVDTHPDALATWSRGLPAAARGSSDAAAFERLIAEVQGLTVRFDDLLEAGDAEHSPAMQRVLAADVRAWRQGLQKMLDTLSADPEALAAEDLASRLTAKLAQIERHARQAIDSDPRFAENPALNENSYRLLGAYRGLFEGLVRLVEAAQLIDWPRLREARF